MTNFPDRETQQSHFDYSDINTGGAAPMWILGAIFAVAILGMIWYGVNRPPRVGPASDQPAIQHTTQPPAQVSPPAEPRAPKP